MADYTNYVRDALFSIEQTVKRDAKMIWTAAHPIYKLLDYQGNHFNQGFNFTGGKMLLPIGTADQANAADGVTVANETSAMTLNTYAGLFQLEYQAAHYRSNIAIRDSDKKIVMSNEHRANFLSYLKKQCLESFKNVLGYDVITPTAIPTGTNSAQATDAIQSLRYILAAANVVGGKDQALDSNWQAVYNTGSGPFSLDLVDLDMDTVKAKGRSQVDFFLCANAAGGYVYSKFRNAIAPGERYVNTDFTRKTGIESYVYRGATCLLDNRNAYGELIGIASDTFYVHLPTEPEVSPMQRITGTDSYDQVYTLWASLGCDDIGCNIRRTGLT